MTLDPDRDEPQAARDEPLEVEVAEYDHLEFSQHDDDELFGAPTDEA